jgi:phosphoribosylanthranilate isomerase
LSDILPGGRRWPILSRFSKSALALLAFVLIQLMEAMATRSIHVAGVIDLAEAQLLIDCGVRYLGFPFVLDHHKEDLTIDAAAAIAAKLRNHATFFLITYLNRAGAILELCHNLSVKMVQLHGETDLEQIRLLKQEAPQLRIIKSLIVRGSNADILIDEVRRYEASVDSFITDTFDPATGASGATGRVHDWEISRRLVALSARPLILAGGLNAGNVRQAIRTVRPAGVDVHTGIEGRDGRKRYDLTRRFVEEAQVGFSEIDVR